MEGPQRHDINELLTTGFFTTARAKSPSKLVSACHMLHCLIYYSSTPVSSNPPPFLQAHDHVTHRHDHGAHRHRSKSRGPRRHPPPRPIVEDEAISLSRESSVSLPTYDPPMRGIIDQNPIILEADINEAEAARLQKIPCSKEDSENPERRFVLIPKVESSGDEVSKNSKPQPSQTEPGKDSRPSLHKRPSRQDLPTLETKVPREIPPKFRRSASAAAVVPPDRDATPRAQATATPRTPSGEYFLSPEAVRGNKEYFSQSVPRYHDNLGGRNGTPVTEKRQSGSSYVGSRPTTPEKRNSVEANKGRPRRPTNEKLNKPHQLADEGAKRADRHGSAHDRLAAGTGMAIGLGVGAATGLANGRTSRSSNHSKHYSGSEDEITDSDSERHRNRRRLQERLRQEELNHRSPSRHSRSSLDPKHSSRLSSPLPSPKVSPSSSPRGDQFERAETFPLPSRNPISRPTSPFSDDKDTPRPDRLNPIEPPRLRQSSTAPHPKTAPYPESFPIPIPGLDMHLPGDTQRMPTIPHFDHSPRPPVSHWQPPPFQPPTQHLDKPVGSFRRYSEEIERGNVAPLPSCPRTNPVRGKHDWLTLPQCPSFDICPSCFASSIAPTEFGSHFVPARRNPDIGVICDFGSSPWYRIAWLLTLKDKRRDLKLFYGLADVADRVQPCLGKNEAVRQWHSIIDPRTNRPMVGFDACSSCVKSVEVLLPAIRGVFVRADTQGLPRICDLRFDSKRFVQYFDALETAADKVQYDDDEPDTRALASLARRLTMFDECEQDKDLIDRRWNVITQLPEFTVCDECFDEVVWPELEEGKAIPMMFAKDKKRVPKASCQLYSPKMRGIFRLAVDSNDYMMLATKARERKNIEIAYKNSLIDMNRGFGFRTEGSERDMRRVEDEWRKWE